MKDTVKYGVTVLDKVCDLCYEARTSYLDHDGRLSGAKLRKLAAYCMKVAGKTVKAKVVDEMHHWIAGDGKKYWVSKNKADEPYITKNVLEAFKCGCPGAAKALANDPMVRHLVQSCCVRPGKFGVYLLNEKVEVSPCRG